ncbi:hypothetical protein EJ110_NYTH04270 [Nymphaea thermarum]|nr:hypothetical protein EJ110_NYTH04270 [Nymphaea thermarum]
MFLYVSVWDASYIDDGRRTGPYVGCDSPYVCKYKDIHVPELEDIGGSSRENLKERLHATLVSYDHAGLLGLLRLSNLLWLLGKDEEPRDIPRLILQSLCKDLEAIELGCFLASYGCCVMHVLCKQLLDSPRSVVNCLLIGIQASPC